MESPEDTTIEVLTLRWEIGGFGLIVVAAPGTRDAHFLVHLERDLVVRVDPGRHREKYPGLEVLETVEDARGRRTGLRLRLHGDAVADLELRLLVVQYEQLRGGEHLGLSV